jgi:hypothetical protein
VRHDRLGRRPCRAPAEAHAVLSRVVGQFHPITSYVAIRVARQTSRSEVVPAFTFPAAGEEERCRPRKYRLVLRNTAGLWPFGSTRTACGNSRCLVKTTSVSPASSRLSNRPARANRASVCRRSRRGGSTALPCESAVGRMGCAATPAEDTGEQFSFFAVGARLGYSPPLCRQFPRRPRRSRGRQPRVSRLVAAMHITNARSSSAASSRGRSR